MKYIKKQGGPMEKLKLALQIEQKAFSLMEKQFKTAVNTIFIQAKKIRKLETQLRGAKTNG